MNTNIHLRQSGSPDPPPTHTPHLPHTAPPSPNRRMLLAGRGGRLWVADAVLDKMSSTEVRANLKDVAANKTRLLELLHPAV